MYADIESQLNSLGATGALSVGAALQADASQYTNSSDVEAMWAIRTHRHAEVYMKLISAIDPKKLKLTKFDDIIYRSFKRYFKTLPVEVINEEDFKSTESKAAWRPFCEQFKDKVEDYNFGSLLRIDSKKDYSEDNCILVTRIQFFAIELARNKRGLNTFHLKEEENQGKEEKKCEQNNNVKELSEKLEKAITEKIDALSTNEQAER